MDECDVIGVTVFPQAFECFKVGWVAEPDAGAKFFLCRLQQVEERTSVPPRRGLADLGRSIFDGVALVGIPQPPSEGSALINRMQGVYDDESMCQVDACLATTQAE